MKESFPHPSSTPESDDAKQQNIKRVGFGAAVLAAGLGAASPDAAQAQNTNLDESNKVEMPNESVGEEVDEMSFYTFLQAFAYGELGHDKALDLVNHSHPLANLARMHHGFTGDVPADADPAAVEQIYNFLHETMKSMTDELKDNPAFKPNQGQEDI